MVYRVLRSAYVLLVI